MVETIGRLIKEYKTMNKFERLKADLALSATGKMKAFGSSMLPILKSGTLLTFETAADYEIGDIVFCKVKGRYIDAHKVIKKDNNKGYLIANNHGWENGWTKVIYGRVVTGEYQNRVIFQRTINNKLSGLNLSNESKG